MKAEGFNHLSIVDPDSVLLKNPAGFEDLGNMQT